MLLEVNALSIAYGDAPAVWDASLGVDAGEIVSVIGPNGAGKSTLVNAIAGVQKARSGEIWFDGADITRLDSHKVCDRGIAIVPEGRRLFKNMTVKENLELGSYGPRGRAASQESLEAVFELFPILRDRKSQISGTMSGGQQQMVAIGRALMARPKLLLMDEPSLGLAPSIVAEMFNAIKSINARDVAVLLVEQNVSQALEIASRAYVIDQGSIVTSGASAALLAQPELRAAYLGIT